MGDGSKKMKEPTNVEEYLKRGEGYFNNGEYDKALEDFSDVIKLAPACDEAHFWRGKVYYFKKEYDKAFEEYSKAIYQNPGNYKAYNNRGNIYKDRKEYDKAIADYNESIRINPNNVFSHNARGDYYSIMKEYDKAIADFSEAIRLDPENAYGFRIRGILYHYNEEYGKAIEDFQEALRLDPDIKIHGEFNYVFALNNTRFPLHERRRILIVPDRVLDIKFVTKLKRLPSYTISKALELFKFPPNHPEPNIVYAMIDLYPDEYIPLSRFHEHYKETKHAAFIELCARLGAKEICIESVEINNTNLDINGDIKTPLSKLGLGFSVRENRETGQKVAFSFSESNRGIKDFESPWLSSEPSWKSMNKLRRESHLSQLGAEFNCTDDMGINAELAGNLKKVGLNIGGEFTAMTKIKLSYNVIFWD